MLYNFVLSSQKGEPERHKIGAQFEIIIDNIREFRKEIYIYIYMYCVQKVYR
jgi:hypothetical protein